MLAFILTQSFGQSCVPFSSFLSSADALAASVDPSFVFSPHLPVRSFCRFVVSLWSLPADHLGNTYIYVTFFQVPPPIAVAKKTRVSLKILIFEVLHLFQGRGGRMILKQSPHYWTLYILQSCLHNSVLRFTNA